MKYFLRLTVILVMLAAGGFSQSLNLRIGPSVSSLNWTNTMSGQSLLRDNVAGLHFALGYDWLMKKYFNMSTNIGLIQKGGHDSLVFVNGVNPEDPGSRDVAVRLNYLTINTLAVGKYPIKGRYIPFLHAGPRIDYLISYGEPVDLLSQFQSGDHLNRIAWGLQLGGGFDIKFGKITTGVVFDYWLNFSRIVDYTSTAGVTNTVKDRTFTIDLEVGIDL